MASLVGMCCAVLVAFERLVNSLVGYAAEESRSSLPDPRPNGSWRDVEFEP
jgi:hypothetical protein